MPLRSVASLWKRAPCLPVSFRADLDMTDAELKNAIDGRQGARALEGLEAGAVKAASLRTAAAFRGAADPDRACAQPHDCRGVMANRVGSHPVWEYDECPVTLFKNSATRSASCGADRSFLLPAADPITGDTRAGVFDRPSNVVFVPALQHYKAKCSSWCSRPALRRSSNRSVGRCGVSTTASRCIDRQLSRTDS